MTTFISSRIYEPPRVAKTYRVLVDRLWPRGVSKEDAALDDWCKDLAPSSELRKWWNHDPSSFDEFAARYHAELDENELLPEILAGLKSHRHVTLLYGAKDPAINHAVVLTSYLRERSA
ncbi:DUF488 domain-containing protein [Salinibacterium sp. PAMC 21357]|uniref:DUF488 domain-containing protein n=1 Tax=Salinibacterium sp. PAMC 21357 TaxID=1112215 RepID=UPI00028A2004|nr:DUF488 family protein [Salinibacterium sp. PAMC 21357]